MPREATIKPNTEQWLEWRRGGIGASDVAAVLDLIPNWDSPFNVWASKVHGLDRGGNDATERGHMLEEAIMKRAKVELGARWHRKGKPTVGPESWMRCTPDYTLTFPDGREELVECKSTRDKLWPVEPPDYYRLQCQWQMLVMGKSVCHLAAYSTMTDEFRVYRVERNNALLGLLVPHLRDWWKRHVIGGEQPEIRYSEVATRYLLQEHPRAKRRLAIATEEDEQLAQQYRQACLRAKAAQAERDHLNALLKERIGDAGGLKGDFGVLKLSRAKRHRIDWKAFRVACPYEDSVLRQYRIASPQLRLTATWDEE